LSDTTESESDALGAHTDRRDLIKKAAIGGAVVWAVPTVLSTQSAFAAGSSAASGIVAVLANVTSTCDPNNLTIDVTTAVTPDLFVPGNFLRFFFTWTGGNTFDSCGAYGLAFPITGTSTTVTWTANGLNTLNIGVAMSVTTDCVNTIASFPAVPTSCGPLPASVQPNGANAATSSASGPHPVPVFK